MKKLIKVLAVLAVVFIALLIVGSVVLRIFLPPEKAKALILQQLTTRLRRQVKIESVSVGVLLGLTVNNLKVSESPDFSKGTFISSDHFSVRLALLPLVMRRVEVSELILDHPEIQIIRQSDGKTFNFSDLTEAPPAAVPAKKADAATDDGHYAFIPDAYAAGPADSAAPESSMQLLVSNAQIRSGIIHFVDRSPAKQSLEMDPLNLRAQECKPHVSVFGADVARAQSQRDCAVP